LIGIYRFSGAISRLQGLAHVDPRNGIRRAGMHMGPGMREPGPEAHGSHRPAPRG